MSEIASGSRIVALVSGLGIGWLAGLSVSPIATVLISSLLGIIGIASSFESESPRRGVFGIIEKIVDSLISKSDNHNGPMTTDSSKPISAPKHVESLSATNSGLFKPWIPVLLILGVCVGTGFGIWTRTHETLGDGDQTIKAYQWMRFGVIPDEVEASNLMKMISADIDSWAKLQLGFSLDDENSLAQISQANEEALKEQKIQIARELFIKFYSFTPVVQAVPTNENSTYSLPNPPVYNATDMASPDEAIAVTDIANAAVLTGNSLGSNCEVLESDAILTPDELPRTAESLRAGSETIKNEFPEDYFGNNPTLLAGAMLWECIRPEN